MTKQVQELIERGDARIVEAPLAKAPACDRSFGLPGALFGWTVACYLGFVALTAMAFSSPMLAIPMVIFALFIVAGFGVPAIWMRMKGNDGRPMTIGQFGIDGIMTNTGWLAPRDATVQVLLLPVLVLCWGLTAVTIAALVA
jgi:hypothetical protein